MSTGRRGRAAAPPRGPRGAGTPTRGGAFRGGSARAPGIDTAPAQGDSDRGAPMRGQRGDRGQRGTSNRGARGNNRGSAAIDRNPMTSPQPGNPRSEMARPSLYPPSTYTDRFEALKADRPRLLAQLVKDKRMDPEGSFQLKDRVKKIAACTDMCPEFERVRRIVENDLKMPEYTAESLQLKDRKQRVADESRLVKAYTRSAAGMGEEFVTDIRTPATCLRTIEFMVERLDHEEFAFLYGWLWDRSRALRKDLSTQDLISPNDAAIALECYERCARLLLLCPHYMSQSSNAEYSLQQDMEQLNQTFITLKEKYADNRRANIVSANEAEFQAYRLILSLSTRDDRIENEVSRLPEPLRRNQRVQTAMRIFRAGKVVLGRERITITQAQQNWRAFWKLTQSPSVSYLMACAAEHFFMQARNHILGTLSRVYRSRSANPEKPLQEWQVSELVELLGFDNEDEVDQFCRAYGYTFSTDANGSMFLDMSQGRVRGTTESKEIQFSHKFVESKRHDRLLSAVIKVPEPQGEEEADSDSLFIPDTSRVIPAASAPVIAAAGYANTTAETSTPANATFGSATGPAKMNTNPNPFANPFQPIGTVASTAPSSIFGSPAALQSTVGSPAATKPSPFFKPSPIQSNAATASPNPFGKPTNPTTSGFSGAFGTLAKLPVAPQNPASPTQPVQPGLFNPATNKVKFSSNNAQAGSPFAPATSGVNETAPQSPSPFSFSGAAAGTSPGQNIPVSSPFQGFGAPSAAAGTTLGQSIPAPSPFKGFGAPVSAPSAKAPTEASGVGLPKPFPFAAGAAANTGPSASPAADEESSRKAQEQEARRVREEQERRSREEQERQAREEQERKAREEQQRRVREEQERRAREEQERRAREEQERRAREEQERRLLEEQKRAAEEEKEQTWKVFVDKMLSDPQEGLATLWLQNTILNMLPEIKTALADEETDKLVAEMYHRRAMRLARAACVKWVRVVQKRKRQREVQARRKRRRESAQAFKAIAQEGMLEPPTASQGPTDSPATEFKKPVAPASANRPQKRGPPTQSQDDKPAKRPAPTAAAPAPPAPQRKSSKRTAPETVANKSPAEAPRKTRPTYQRPYYPPADRTDTTWFEYRAQGLDPSKYFPGFDSDPELEGRNKKAKRTQNASPGSDMTSRRESLKSSRAQPTATSNRYSTISPSPSMSNSGRRSAQDARAKYNDLIARAREVLAMPKSPSTPNGSPPQPVKNDFGRSVPVLSLRQSGTGTGRLNHSHSYGYNAPDVSDRPAFWGRQSRFLPQHLYGKGPEAVEEWIQEKKRASARYTSTSTYDPEPTYNPEPLDLSSPIPTQQSYVPDSRDGTASEDMSSNGDDDGVNYEYSDEYDEEDEDEEMSDIADDDDEYGLTYQDQEQNAQKVGGTTQDDAIELSD